MVFPPSSRFTDYTYDGWGVLVTETTHHGVVTTYEEGWGTTAAKRYYQKQSADGQPWVKVWYDECGREVERESIGPKGISVGSTTAYDSRGNVTATTSTSGNLTLSESFTYDSRNRIISDIHSSGRTITYSYGNRSVTATVNGHVCSKTFDAWGNVKTSTDSAATVTYTYYSSGLPATTASGGATVSMQYDVAGNRTSITDPDAGITTCTYSADGKLLSQTDARGVTTTYTYNAFGCVTTRQTGNKTVTNTYGSYGSAQLLPQQSAMGSYNVSYTYDGDDRVTAETCSFPGGTTLSFGYTYNDLGQLTQADYPGNVSVGYGYDSHGFLTGMTVGGQQVYSHTYANGVRDSVKLLNVYDYTADHDSYGYLTEQKWNRNGIYRNKLYEYDHATGNLLMQSARYFDLVPIGPKSDNLEPKGFTPGPSIPYGQIFADSYRYDALDRLVSVRDYLDQLKDTIVYAANGNILSRTGIGAYSYDATGRPHAVLSVSNPQGLVSQETLETTYGDLGKIEQIAQGDYETTIDYGPNGERWRSVFEYDGAVERTVLYAGDYEQVTAGGSTRHYYYLGNGVIVMKEGSTVTPLVAVVDHLGSITNLLKADGTCLFSARYDAWGNQTVTTNTINFYRGYCGHEMLPEYGLINMNGRLYDPLLGRFLSPDNYVQQPDNSQNFNRYTYCLNNPLKYVDPDGESIIGAIIVGAIIGGVVNLATKAHSGQIHNFWDGFKAFSIGAAAGGVAGGTGGWAFSVIGSSTAAGAGGFWAGMASGALGSATSIPLQSWGNHWVFGDNNISFRNYVLAIATSAVLGGTVNGSIAKANGRNFWTGKTNVSSPVNLPTPTPAETSPIQNNGVNPSASIEPTEQINATQVTPNQIAQNTMQSPSFPSGSGDVSVYVGYDESIVKYVGISNDVDRRFYQHLMSGTSRAGLEYRILPDATNLSRIQARIIEQNLINYYRLNSVGGQLFNKINSISPRYWNNYGIGITIRINF